MTTTWRVAKSLETLLAQLNAIAPARSKESDGGIGDAEHASRKSDHNPWVIDSKGVGVVTARDFTHDPLRGVDCEVLASSLVHSGDDRIKYVIWNYNIWTASTGKWAPYTGVNPHNHHMHISVSDKPELYDDAGSWAFALNPPDPTAKAEFEQPVLKKGMQRDKVREVQKLLGVTVDGVFGDETFKAVCKFQKRANLIADGVVGRYTWEKLLAS